jgi:ribulose 1,5-bisphosphate carboxylase large subunit-like protein
VEERNKTECALTLAKQALAQIARPHLDYVKDKEEFFGNGFHYCIDRAREALRHIEALEERN